MIGLGFLIELAICFFRGQEEAAGEAGLARFDESLADFAPRFGGAERLLVFGEEFDGGRVLLGGLFPAGEFAMGVSRQDQGLGLIRRPLEARVRGRGLLEGRERFLRPLLRRWMDAVCGTVLLALGVRLALGQR